MTNGGSAKELLERCKSGDNAACGQLYQRYAERLCQLAERLIGKRLKQRYGPDDAADSAFGSFFRQAADGHYQIDHSGALWRLLVTIMLNKIRGEGRKRNCDPLPPDVVARGPSHEAAVDLADLLEAAVSDLSPRDAKICRLWHCQEHLIEEIAAQVGCSRGTVRRVVDRFCRQLRRDLGEEGAEPGPSS